MRIQAVRYFDHNEPDTDNQLLRFAEYRLREWGRWEAVGNSLSELQAHSCLRPHRPGGTVQIENPAAVHVGQVLREFMAMDAYSVLMGIYIRRLTQRETARQMEVSRQTVERIVRRARLVVAAQCL